MAIIDKLSRYYNEEELLDISEALKAYNEKVSEAWENAAKECPEDPKIGGELVNALLAVSNVRDELEAKAFERYLVDVEREGGKLIAADAEEILGAFTLADFERYVRLNSGFFSRTEEGCTNYIKNILLKHQYNAAERLNFPEKEIAKIDKAANWKALQFYPPTAPTLQSVTVGTTKIQQKIFHSTEPILKSNEDQHKFKVGRGEMTVSFSQDVDILSENYFSELVLSFFSSFMLEAEKQGSLSSRGCAYVTLENITYAFKDFYQGKSRKDNLGEDLPRRIDQTVQRLKGISIALDVESQIRNWNDTKKKPSLDSDIERVSGFAAPLLPVVRVQRGEEIGYYIFRLPTLTDYASLVGQVQSFSISSQETGSSGNRLTTENIVIDSLLKTRLITMQNKKERKLLCNEERRILFDTIYRNVGYAKAIDKGELAPEEYTRSEKQRIRDRTIKQLEHILKAGTIKDFISFTILDEKNGEHSPNLKLSSGLKAKGIVIYFKNDKALPAPKKALPACKKTPK